jgi:hypothetical protein
MMAADFLGGRVKEGALGVLSGFGQWALSSV